MWPTRWIDSASSSLSLVDYAGARPVYERVLSISETVHGPDHPHVGVVRQHLAEVLAAAGDVGGAVEMALAAERIGRDHLRLIGRTLPEREALMYAAMRPAGLDVALSLLARQRGSGSISSDAVWDAVVRSRAVVLDEMASRRRTTDADGSADLAALLRTLSTKREQLARLVVRGPQVPVSSIASTSTPRARHETKPSVPSPSGVASSGRSSESGYSVSTRRSQGSRHRARSSVSSATSSTRLAMTARALRQSPLPRISPLSSALAIPVRRRLCRSEPLPVWTK